MAVAAAPRTAVPATAGTPGQGGSGWCSAGGVNVSGDPGGADGTGGGTADGIVELPAGAAVGGDGGRGGGAPRAIGHSGSRGKDGGDGYAVIYW